MHARAGSYLPREEPPQGHNDRQTAPPPGKEKASPAAPNPEEPASENEGDDNGRNLNADFCFRTRRSQIRRCFWLCFIFVLIRVGKNRVNML